MPMNNNILSNIENVRFGATAPMMLRRRTRHILDRHLNLTLSNTFENINTIYYADLLHNKLLVTTNFTKFKIFDMNNDSLLHFPTAGQWIPPTDRNVCTVGLPCATWGENCSFILASGNGNHLVILDTTTFTAIENIALDYGGRTTLRWSSIGHETCPYNSNLVAVACENGTVPIIDLRTGHTEFKNFQMLGNINSVAWSTFHENILACTSSTSESLYMWDIRRCSKRFLQMVYTSETSPDLQFVDYRTIACLRDMSIDTIDIFKEEIINSVATAENNIQLNRKQKFAISYNSNPRLIFLPAYEELSVLDLNTFALVNSYRNSLFPLNFVLLNENRQELYGLTDKEIVIWTQSLSNINSSRT